MAAGRTVSFIADPSHQDRVAEPARADGVTRSQAAARISALGALPSAAAWRAARFIIEEGDEDAKQQLSTALAKAIARTSNALLERQLLAAAEARGLTTNETEGELEARAVNAIDSFRKERRAG